MMAPIGWIALLLTWVLFFWLYRDYRVDFFRQQLFMLRDELFDIAVEGKISFGDPAYGKLRSTINGTIQFGHKLGFLNLLCLVVMTRGDRIDEKGFKEFNDKWKQACDALDAETAQRLQSIHFRLHFAIVEQIVFTSFVLTVTIFALVAAHFVRTRAEHCMDRFFSTRSAKRLFSFLDYSAAMHAS